MLLAKEFGCSFKVFWVGQIRFKSSPVCDNLRV
jgi:hypothetical protein